MPTSLTPTKTEANFSRDAQIAQAVDFGLGKEQHGIQAIRDKHAFWEQHNETHAVTVGGPYVGTGNFANRFALHFLFDLTQKATGVRDGQLHRVQDDMASHRGVAGLGVAEQGIAGSPVLVHLLVTPRWH